MRVLVVHNRYRPEAPSGENAVVDQESAALVESGHRVELFQRHSAEIADWPLHRRARVPFQVLWNEQSRRRLAAELVGFAPDIVHLHNTFPLLTPAVLHACRDAGVPVVATLHNYKLACASGEFYRSGSVCHDCLGGSPVPALTHGCYRGSRLATAPVAAAGLIHAAAWRHLVGAYIFISAAQRDLLAPLGLPLERSFVKHNLVPAGEFEAGPKRPVVGYFGRLDPAKGAPFLMAAWDAFRRRRPSSTLELIVAGSGPYRQQVENWSATHPSVRMLGPVPRAEVGRILARARAVVVPSQWEETFGLVVVEAMAAGTAAIAADHGGPAELVTPGRDGALFPPTEIDSLADLFAEVDDHPERWDGYGRQAYLTYQRRFDVGANLDRLLEIYRFALAHPIETAAKPPVSRGILAALLPRGSNGSASGEPGTALDARGQELP